MKTKMINTEHIEGRVYQHDLTIQTVKNEASANFGKQFIKGKLNVAVDEAGLNVLEVNFQYVKEGVATFNVLKSIIESGKTWIANGKDEATMVSINTNFGLNDFYSQDERMVSAPMNSGGFVNIVTQLCPEEERNTFSFDMVITSVNEVEGNEEMNIPDHLDLRGAVFDYKNRLLPTTLTVENQAGMNFFLDAEISNSSPLFTKVWGKICNESITTSSTEESAFGESLVTSRPRKSKKWLVTGTSKFPYDFGSEDYLTAEDLTKAMQDREIWLAEVKKRALDYRASQGAPTPNAASAAPKIATQTFNF